MVGWRPGLVVLLDHEAPRLELSQRHAGPEVGAFGERDRRARPAEREHARRHRRRARPEEECVAALDLAERLLRLGTSLVRVALVDERARIAALVVGPRGGAIDRLHAAKSTWPLGS